MRYQAITHDGHILADLGGRTALIDTGCPVSLGYGGPLAIGGRLFPLAESYYDFRFDELRRLVGYEFDLVVGMDAMATVDVRFSLRERFVEFEESTHTVGTATEIDTFYGVPITPIDVNGRSFRLIFDTGAPLSYLVPEAIGQCPAVGKRMDFYPGKGRFNVLMRRTQVGIADQRLELCFGEMEGPLKAMLEPAGVPGILGTEVLTFADVTLSMRRRTLVFRWHQGANAPAA